LWSCRAKKLTIPFVASGGVGNGRQLAAALALGAAGVNMGTRFMATREAPIHANIKAALVEGTERSTTHVFRSLKVSLMTSAFCFFYFYSRLTPLYSFPTLHHPHVLRFLKNTERVYKNAQATKVRDAEAVSPGDFGAIRPYVSGSMYKDSFQTTGDTQSSVWSAGVVMGLIEDVPSCAELLERMVAEAEAVIGGMGAFTASSKL